MLDLSGAAALDPASCRDLGLLLQRWRADPSVPEIRKLVLDNIDKVAHSIELHAIVYGGCMPGNEPVGGCRRLLAHHERNSAGLHLVRLLRCTYMEGGH